MFKKHLSLTLSLLWLASNSIIFSMQFMEPEYNESTAWIDAFDYANYIQDVYATSNEMCQTIQSTFNISDKQIDECRNSLGYTKPKDQLINSVFVHQYKKMNNLSFNPWKVSSDPNGATRVICSETFDLLRQSIRSLKELTPKNVGALLHLAQICEERHKKFSPNWAHPVEKETMQIARQKFEKTVESAKQKFGTEIKTDFPGDLPESLQNAYDYYEKDNAYKKKLNKKLKDTSVREVCNGVSAEVTKAFFQIQMGKARNINTGHDLSERNVELVVDLLAAAQICEEIQNNQKVDKEKQ